jgi:hypothetical protein
VGGQLRTPEWCGWRAAASRKLAIEIGEQLDRAPDGRS